MKFDWTISFGHVLTLLSLIVAGGVGYVNLVRRIDRIERNLDQVFEWFEDNVIRGGHGYYLSIPRKQAHRNKRRPDYEEDAGGGSQSFEND